ncbi:MAG: class I SAM-dependent methyltransferase [Flavobacteriaceae bacterium]|nr:class I SAM-dependent methyltransferase [Flavobacteriaceae bacterium]
MENSKCKLCNHNELTKIQSIPKQDLIELYQETYGIAIEDQLTGVAEIDYYKCSNCNLESFDNNTAGDGSFYEQLQLKRQTYYSPDRKEFSFAQKYITTSDKILEIGSGSGLFAQRLVKDNYIGLEFNDKAIADAKANQITLLKQSIEEYATGTKNEFDVVCTFHVLEHVKEPFEFIEAALATLKKGGKLIIAVPCNDSIYTSNVNHVLNLPPHHIGRWQIDTMKNLEKIFNIKLLDQEISSPSEVLNKKEYIGELLTHKVLKVLYPKQQLLLDKTKVKRVRRIIYKLNSILKLYKHYRNEDVIGENMTFVYQKLT